MGLSIKYGLGVGTEKRDLRERKKDLKNTPFRNPEKLIKDILELIFLIFYIPIRNFMRYFKDNPKSIRGKICFVTGSGRGLGRELCIALAKEGAIIACADVIEENNTETVRILEDMGFKAKGYKLNVANKREVDAIVEKVERDLGRVYLLVNNAAIVMPHPEMDEAYIRAVYNVNTLGPIWTSMAFLARMKEAREGHILNVSSLSAQYGVPFLPFYGSSKAALTNYFQALRLELCFLGYDNIFITNVHPSFINTSADYVDAVDTRLGIDEMETVVKFTVNAVLHNKTDTSNNKMQYTLYSFASFMPLEIIRKCISTLDVSIQLPTNAEYKNIPTSKLVEVGNILESKTPS